MRKTDHGLPSFLCFGCPVLKFRRCYLLIQRTAYLPTSMSHVTDYAMEVRPHHGWSTPLINLCSKRLDPRLIIWHDLSSCGEAGGGITLEGVRVSLELIPSWWIPVTQIASNLREEWPSYGE